MKLQLDIGVPDLARAERFHGAAFGRQPSRRFDDEVVEFLAADVAIYPLRKRAGSPGTGNSKRDYSRHWTPLHAGVVVDDLKAGLERAVDAGAVQEGGIRTAAWGRIVQFADPFGHGWRLIQFQGRGYDEIAT